jgi:hypothetical protein
VRRFRVQRSSVVWLGILAIAFGLITRAAILWVVVAALATGLLLRIGFGMLRGLAQPIPEPPPAGELRKVKLTFRCSICGTEVRMTTANDEMPDPPRHCLEDMDLVTPVDDR